MIYKAKLYERQQITVISRENMHANIWSHGCIPY